MKTNKIAFFVPTLVVGGMETVFINTLSALLKYEDVELTVFAHRQITEPIHVQWFKEHPEVKLYVYYPFGNFFEYLKEYIEFFPLKQIRKILFSLYKRYKDFYMRYKHNFSKYDVIIDYISGFSFKQLRRVHNVPKITWLHCSINYFNDNNLIARMSQYKKIVSISDSCLEDFKQVYPDYADKLCRIYNPIDIDRIREISNTFESKNDRYFCCVSRIDKDIKTIIEAFDAFWILNNQPSCKLLIIGSGNILKDMQQLAKTKKSASNIVFLGKIPHPYGYMHNALAHILSSYNEGLPTVLIEAMAAGTLNISSNCKNGPHEILLEGDAGLLFEPGNVSDLTKALDDVWNNKIDRKQIISTATRSLQRFEPKYIAKDIICLIERIKTKKENK